MHLRTLVLVISEYTPNNVVLVRSVWQDSKFGNDELGGDADEYGYTEEFIREKYSNLSSDGQVRSHSSSSIVLIDQQSSSILQDRSARE